LVWDGEEGTTMVATPQLMSMNSFEEFHVNSSKEVNAVRGTQDRQMINLVAKLQSLTKDNNDATFPSYNLRLGFGMLVMVASN